MNEQSNVPISAGSDRPSGVASWFSTWMIAVTKPSEQTFATLAEHPDTASNNRAFTWVFLAGTVSALISGVLGTILSLAGFAQTPGMAEIFGGDAQRGVAFEFGIVICSAPLAGAFSVLIFAIGAGVVQWLARLFKGTGTYSQMAYTLAAISVPYTLVTSFLAPFSSIPILGVCTGLVSLGLLIYVIVLEVMAVKGVNKIDWLPAIGSVLLPFFVLFCCVVVAIFVLAGMGVAIGETFNSIQNSLP